MENRREKMSHLFEVTRPKVHDVYVIHERRMDRAIAVVDPEEKAAEIIRDMLIRYGFSNVKIYHDAIAVFRTAFRNEIPDLVITVDGMDRISGTDLLDQLSHLRGRQVPGILLCEDVGKLGVLPSMRRAMEKTAPGFFAELIENALCLLRIADLR